MKIPDTTIAPGPKRTLPSGRQLVCAGWSIRRLLSSGDSQMMLNSNSLPKPGRGWEGTLSSAAPELAHVVHER